MLVGCTFFKVSTSYDITSEQIQIAKEDYIIVHTPQGEAYHLNHINIDTEKNEINGVKENIDQKHHLLNDVSYKKNRYKPKLNPRHDELHIYAKVNDEISTDHIKILIKDISKVEVYNKQTELLILQYLGGAVAFAGAAFIIYLMTKSSCPFIYTLDENDYNFRGEIYGGAIAPNLERDDYMPLPGFNSIDSIFKLKITNELKERQYTDVAELLMVEHANDMEVLMDSYGVPYSLKHLVSPKTAHTDLGNDYLSEIKTHDGVAYHFFDETIDNKDFSSIDLSFISSAQTNQMKLILNLKNTIWLDHTFERFGSLMGDQYDRISSKQKLVSAQQKNQWSKDEGIMLAVKLKTANGWRTIDHINTVGPLASRSIVVPIEADCQPGDELIVRLESGYHFWEVDYAAMDFTKNDSLEITRLPLLAALDENNIDLMSAIAYHDGTYLDQPYIGAEAILTFDGRPTIQSEKKSTLFLHTRGYYEYIRDYKGKPNISELKKFKLTGTFARFAKARFSQIAGL
ncbi:MAG: hypothetical protein P8O87_06520 [Crocinitomicaceae bacterium]|nr:hypothetical protein [Crocinitomicaceae bacterium]